MSNYNLIAAHLKRAGLSFNKIQELMKSGDRAQLTYYLKLASVPLSTIKNMLDSLEKPKDMQGLQQETKEKILEIVPLEQVPDSIKEIIKETETDEAIVEFIRTGGVLPGFLPTDVAEETPEPEVEPEPVDYDALWFESPLKWGEEAKRLHSLLGTQAKAAEEMKISRQGYIARMKKLYPKNASD